MSHDERPAPARVSAHRFRTSREAYDWIRWDPAFDPAEFAVLYDDHDAALAEIALPAFDPEGEIPWHRVRALRHKREIVWDRDARIDRLAELRSSLQPDRSASAGPDRS